MKAKVFSFLMFGFLFGAGIAPLFIVETLELLYLCLILLISAVFVYRLEKVFVVLVFISFILFGVFLYQYRLEKYTLLNDSVHSKKYSIVAIIDEIPRKTEHGYMSKLRILNLNEQKSSSRVVAYLPEEQLASFNEIIAFDGKIKQLDDKKIGWLIKEGVIGEVSVYQFEKIGINKEKSLKSYLFALRIRFNQAINVALPKNESNLASGLILGEKANFDAEAKRNLQAAGVTHIIALSGYNITIILGLFVYFERRLSRLLNLLGPIVLILFFVIMTGASASIVRAGIMGVMPILARFLFRPKNAVLAILFSAFLMVAINPFILLHDIGFQLSFVALMGLMYISPKVKSLSRKNNVLVGLFSETVGAQLAVLPLLIYYFGNISLISPFSNLLILLFVPLGMLVSFLTGFLGIFSRTLGYLVAIPTFAVLRFINLSIKFFGELPFAMVQYQISNPLWLLVMYLILIYFLVFFKMGKARRPSGLRAEERGSFEVLRP